MSDGRRPNILWISFEDTNPFYGCYGDKVANTPNLDRFAEQGCIWSNCFSTAGVCAPARSAVITGMYPISIGTMHMRTRHTNDAAPELPTPYSAVIPHYAKCFSEYLRGAGYYCTNNDKTDYQFEPPFTAWDECSKTAHWRNRPSQDQPFFAVFNLTRTHESGMWDDKDQEITTDPANIELPPYFPDTPKVRTSMARMYSSITYNDGLFGDLLTQLEEDGLADNTIVFHWSDHGPLPRGKRWPYDSGVHVPMIVRWPHSIEPGTENERLISTVDLAPTVMSLCDIDVPRHFQGRAFLGDQDARERDYVYMSRDRYDESYDMVRAVRDKRYKYIRNCRPELPYLLWIPYRNRHPILQEMWRLYLAGELKDEQLAQFHYPRPSEELYDTKADPFELHNLARDSAHRGELRRLRDACDKWTDRVGDLGKMPESEMVRQWYPDGKQPQTAAPVFVPISTLKPGTSALSESDEADAVFVGDHPWIVQLYCATQGASIGYTFDLGEDPNWALYTKPVSLPEGDSVLRAKAIRIGYKESREAVARLS
jgi:N-sulfoglucosamine sulfohydrolase